MVSDGPQLTCRSAPWFEVEPFFRLIRDDHWHGLDQLAEAGEVGLFVLSEDGDPIGGLALSIDATGRWLFVQALGARGDVLPSLTFWLVVTARAYGLRGMMCKTRRRGLVRRLERLGGRARALPGEVGRWRVEVEAA